jgi:hypothetical protein
MAARTAWTLERLPWFSTRKAHVAADVTPEGAVFTLASWATRSLDVRRGRAVEVLCLSGLVHATFEGDPLDHVLCEGQTLRVAGPGRLVLAGLDPSRVALRATRERRTSGERPPAPPALPPATRLGRAS